MSLRMSQSVHSGVHSAKCTRCQSTNVRLIVDNSCYVVDLYQPISVEGEKDFDYKMSKTGECCIGGDRIQITGYTCLDCQNTETLDEDAPVSKAPWYRLVGKLYESILGIKLRKDGLISGSDNGISCDQAGTGFISSKGSLNIVSGRGNITNRVLWE